MMCDIFAFLFVYTELILTTLFSSFKCHKRKNFGFCFRSLFTEDDSCFFFFAEVYYFTYVADLELDNLKFSQ
jgi:hypothetical protein